MQNNGLFDDITSRVLDSCVHVKVRRGQVICLQEDKISYLYMVVKGEVTLTSTSLGDSDILIAVVRAGHFFGETDLLLNDTASFTAIARVNSVIRKVSKIKFENLLQIPEISTKMLAYIAQQNRINLERLAIVSCHSNTRVEAGLNWLGRTMGVQTDKGVRIDLTMEQIAKAIGYTREAMSRCVSKLIQQHKVKKDSCYHRCLYLLNGNASKLGGKV